MPVFHVTFTCRPGTRDEFLNRIRAEWIDAACRREEGNLAYDYFLPAEGGDKLLLIERWRDMAALAAHAGQPHMARMDELKARYVTDMAIEMLEPVPMKGPPAGERP